MSQVSANELASRYRYVRRFLRRHGAAVEADDIAQQVFSEVVASAGRTDLPLLLTIARRRLIDYRRKEGRARPSREGELAACEARPDLSSVVADGLRRLPTDQRQVVVLKLVRGLSFAEISQAVGASEGACKMRLRRGLHTLQAFLEDQGIRP